MLRRSRLLTASIVWTTDKLRKEYERRQETNARAVAVLMNNLHLWNHVDGPAPGDELLNPSEIALLAAKDSCRALACLAEAHGSSRMSSPPTSMRSPRQLLP